MPQSPVGAASTSGRWRSHGNARSRPTITPRPKSTPARAPGPPGQALTAHALAGSAQRMRALERANEVRVARATLKRLIGSGEITVAQAILSRVSEIQNMAVIELLLSQRSWGHARCRGVLAAIPMSENKAVGSMTDRQQGVLVEMLTSEGRPQALEWSSRPRDHRALGSRQPSRG